MRIKISISHFMKKNLFVALSLLGSIFLSISIQSCYNDNEEDLYGSSTTICDTAIGTYTKNVLPILNAQCATTGCHNATTASAGANLSGYATTKSYITNKKNLFIGSIKHTSGFSAMPKGGNKLAACEISKIESWINAGMSNN